MAEKFLPVSKERLLVALRAVSYQDVGLGFNPVEHIDATASSLSFMLGALATDLRVKFPTEQPTVDDIHQLRRDAVATVVRGFGLEDTPSTRAWWYRLWVAYGW